MSEYPSNGKPGRSSRFAPSATTSRPWLIVAALAMASCSSPNNPSTELSVVGATIVSTPLSTSVCSGRFVPHALDHVTTGRGGSSDTFDGTGSGVALGDVDGDGDLDVVAANLKGDSTLLVNQGDFDFTASPLIEGRFRQVAILDFDGDDDNDVSLSSGVGPPVMLFNSGDGKEFERKRLVGVDAATYAMAWGDLGGDGDLDLVTGSYNAELSIIRNTPVIGSDTGVVVYDQNPDGTFARNRIAAVAQALTIRLVDIDGNHLPDIIVGNDLATPDGIWVDNGGGWLAVTPLDETSFSTMSLDAGDVDNDGDLDLFATDMKPRADDAQADQRYAEVNEDMAALGVQDGVQRPENVLNLGGENFENVATAFGVDATGWSWSGIFGDLDSDRLLDLYVVTGMSSDNLFAELPDSTLVEPNQAFANTGDSMERRPEWGLEDTDGGRGMAMGDLDGDGDLDIVINNLNAPLRAYENQLCGGSNLVVNLRWSGTKNLAAVGATVIATVDEITMTRTIDLTRGYLSGGPASAHFGLGNWDLEVPLSIIWPDGMTSAITAPTNHKVTVSR